MTATLRRCPYSGCHPPDERTYELREDELSGEDIRHEFTVCPGCGQRVEVLIEVRWPEGHFPRMAAHTVGDA